MSENHTPVLAVSIAIAVVLAAIGGYVAYRWLDDGGSPDDGDNPTLDRRIVFPKDEGAHDEPFETWYIQADLKTFDNERFSLSVAFSQFDTYSHRDISLVPLSPAGPRVSSFMLDGSMSSTKGGLDLTYSYDDGPDDRFYSTGDFTYRLEFSLGEFNFTLDIEDEKGVPVLPYDEGRRTDYNIGSSFEYLQTRLSVFGQCNLSGYSGYIRGSAWMRHSWDFMNRYPEDMHCIQLKDERDVWVYQMWDPTRQPYKDCVIVVEGDGNYTQYEDTPLSVEYGRYSTDEQNPKINIIAFPSAWSLTSDEAAIDLDIVGSSENQFMSSSWAGLSSAAGTLGGESVSGIALSTSSCNFYANPKVTSVYSAYLDADLLPLQNFTVRASVQDALPIAQVLLRYNVSREAPADPDYIEVEMQLGDDGFYYGAFRNPLYNWVVSFKVIVVDIVGAWGESERYDESISWDTP